MSAKANLRYWPSIDQALWHHVRDHYRLLTMEECEQHFETLYDDAEPYMQQERSGTTGNPGHRKIPPRWGIRRDF